MARPLIERAMSALDHDFGAPFAIGGGAAVALVWTALSESSYRHAIDVPWTRSLDAFSVNSLHTFASSGLMTLFFFTVGMELSRELNTGTLMKPRHSLPPLVGAVGGMAATALLSIVVGTISHTPALVHGWGIPMATDIAFTLGVLALVGGGIPIALRLFLLTLAVADDVLSIAALSITGAAHLRVLGLVVFVVAVLVLAVLSRRATSIVWRLGVLAILWLCLTWANVEPPLAGVIAALLVPFERKSALALERQMNRISVGVVLPLFALVSCGVSWSNLAWRGSTLTIIWGTVAVRLVGKTLGITGGVALVGLFGLRRHATITWPLLTTASLLCAIGFTVPLLFTSALYESSSAAYSAFTVGLLIASVIAGIVGVLLLKRLTRRTQHRQQGGP